MPAGHGCGARYGRGARYGCCARYGRSARDGLTAEDANQGDHFGESVSISGNTVAVGARAARNFAGSAYVFLRNDDGTWSQQDKLANDAAAFDRFGSSISIDRDTIVVGAGFDDGCGEDTGSAYFFDLNCPSDCPADIDGSGTVDFDDLLRLLAAWGPCE